MREIKFRGKRTDTGEWVYGDLIENQGRFFIYHATSETTLKDEDNSIIVLAEEVNLDTVGQYTGLKDRKIYEGDIVQWYQLDMDFYSGGGFMDIKTGRIARKMHAVYFAEGGFRLDPIVNGDLPSYTIPELYELCGPSGVYPGELFFENDPDYPDNRDEFPGIEKRDLYRAEVIGNIYDKNFESHDGRKTERNN